MSLYDDLVELTRRAFPELHPPQEHADKPLHRIQIPGGAEEIWLLGGGVTLGLWCRTPTREWYNHRDAFAEGFRYLGPAEWTPPETVAADEKAIDDAGPKDFIHDRVYEAAKDVANGRVAKPSREMLRKALDIADKPPEGRAASDAGVGRAIRLGR